MKKKLLLLPLVTLSFISLTGCEKEKVDLTYGTYITQKIGSLKPISASDLSNKTENENEVLILATYQESYSEDCLCWTTFQNVIVNYMNKYNERVYLFNTESNDELIGKLNIEKYEDSTPALYIFKGTNQLAKFTYKKSRDKAIFTELSAEPMYKRIHEYINKPLIFDVDDNYLSNKISTNKETVALFVRRGCSDCLYSLNNVIIPYIYSNDVNKEILMIDLQDIYESSKADSNDNAYQNIKDKYGLSESGSKTFGYGNGFVPTIQYYKNGILNDASVFFNDELTKNEDGSYYIINSFYTEERLTSLFYCYGMDNCVLKGMKIPSEDVVLTKTAKAFWAQEKAAVYHTPLLKAFIECYCSSASIA